MGHRRQRRRGLRCKYQNRALLLLPLLRDEKVALGAVQLSSSLLSRTSLSAWSSCWRRRLRCRSRSPGRFLFACFSSSSFLFLFSFLLASRPDRPRRPRPPHRLWDLFQLELALLDVPAEPRRGVEPVFQLLERGGGSARLYRCFGGLEGCERRGEIRRRSGDSGRRCRSRRVHRGLLLPATSAPGRVADRRRFLCGYGHPAALGGGVRCHSGRSSGGVRGKKGRRRRRRRRRDPLRRLDDQGRPHRHGGLAVIEFLFFFIITSSNGRKRPRRRGLRRGERGVLALFLFFFFVVAVAAVLCSSSAQRHGRLRRLEPRPPLAVYFLQLLARVVILLLLVGWPLLLLLGRFRCCFEGEREKDDW